MSSQIEAMKGVTKGIEGVKKLRFKALLAYLNLHNIDGFTMNMMYTRTKS